MRGPEWRRIGGPPPGHARKEKGCATAGWKRGGGVGRWNSGRGGRVGYENWGGGREEQGGGGGEGLRGGGAGGGGGGGEVGVDGGGG